MSVRAQQRSGVRPRGLQPARLLCPWDFPGRNTGVGCPALLQGILPTQGLNRVSRTGRQTPYCQCRLGSLRDFWGDSKRRRKGFDGTGFREEGWLAFRAGTEEVSSSHGRKAKLRERMWKGALGELISENLHILCVRREGWGAM